MEKRKPLLITFEGGEGSGKSEQVKLFYPWFKEVYDPLAINAREPGGILVAEEIRKLLLDSKYKDSMSDRTELFLFGAARSSFYNYLVIPALFRSESVVLDRSRDSTTAYQGYGRGLDINIINKVNDCATYGIYPDITFVINIDPVIGLKNAIKRGKMNRIDLEKIEFHKKVNNGYLEIAKLNPERCKVIEYEEGIENVQLKIREEFLKKYL